MKEFTRVPGSAGFGDRASHALSGALTRLDQLHALAVVLALALTTYLAVEPTQNWLLLLISGLAALGTDHIVREHPKARFKRLDDTALFLFVPVLFTLAMGMFLNDVVHGYLSIPIGLMSVVPYWLILRAEYESVNHKSPDFQLARMVLNIATYVIAFLFFATIYDFDLGLVAASFAAGIVTVLLGIEVLREEAMDTGRTIVYAVVIGGLLAEAAWVTHFLPLDGGIAAVFLLLAFYLMTGMMHNYLAARLNLRTATEFLAVAVAGVAIVAISNTYF